MLIISKYRIFLILYLFCFINVSAQYNILDLGVDPFKPIKSFSKVELIYGQQNTEYIQTLYFGVRPFVLRKVSLYKVYDSTTQNKFVTLLFEKREFQKFIQNDTFKNEYFNENLLNNIQSLAVDSNDLAPIIINDTASPRPPESLNAPSNYDLFIERQSSCPYISKPNFHKEVSIYLISNHESFTAFIEDTFKIIMVTNYFDVNVSPYLNLRASSTKIYTFINKYIHHFYELNSLIKEVIEKGLSFERNLFDSINDSPNQKKWKLVSVEENKYFDNDENGQVRVPFIKDHKITIGQPFIANYNFFLCNPILVLKKFDGYTYKNMLSSLSFNNKQLSKTRRRKLLKLVTPQSSIESYITRGEKYPYSYLKKEIYYFPNTKADSISSYEAVLTDKKEILIIVTCNKNLITNIKEIKKSKLFKKQNTPQSIEIKYYY